MPKALSGELIPIASALDPEKIWKSQNKKGDRGTIHLPVAEFGGGDAGFLFELRCEIFRVLELEYDGYFL